MGMQKLLLIIKFSTSVMVADIFVVCLFVFFCIFLDQTVSFMVKNFERHVYAESPLIEEMQKFVQWLSVA